MYSHLLPLAAAAHSTQRYEVPEALRQAIQRHNCPPTLLSWGITCLKTQFIQNKSSFLLLRMLYLQKWPVFWKSVWLEIHSRNDLQRLTRKVGFLFWQSPVYFFPYHLCCFFHYENRERGIDRVKQGHLFLFHICNQGLSILPYVLVRPVLLFRSPSFCCLFQMHCFPRPPL